MLFHDLWCRLYCFCKVHEQSNRPEIQEYINLQIVCQHYFRSKSMGRIHGGVATRKVFFNEILVCYFTWVWFGPMSWGKYLQRYGVVDAGRALEEITITKAVKSSRRKRRIIWPTQAEVQLLWIDMIVGQLYIIQRLCSLTSSTVCFKVVGRVHQGEASYKTQIMFVIWFKGRSSFFPPSKFPCLPCVRFIMSTQR